MTELYKKHLMTTQDWKNEELDEILGVAKDMKGHLRKALYRDS
jgi:ornithine carbamoyltransferase